MSSSAPIDIERISNGSAQAMHVIPGHKEALSEINPASDWTSFLSSESLSNLHDTDMEQWMHDDVNEDYWGTGAKNHFSMPNPTSFMGRAERQQKRELPGEDHQQQLLSQTLQHPHQQQQQQQHGAYQLQQQQQLRLQLELASQTRLPQTPAPGMAFSLGAGSHQFPTGHSPTLSPLSPGNLGGDDYFTSQQASPGLAASPGGTSKIKSRPRPLTAGARYSQGGIKALFGQSLPKNNRSSLDSRSEAASHHAQLQQGFADISLKGSPGLQTSPVVKGKTLKARSAEIPIVSSQMMGAAAPARGHQGPSTPTGGITAAMTLAERRALSAATATHHHQQGSTSDPMASIPLSLSLETPPKRIVLPPNLTPGSENGPLSSPALLSTSASSPAPIQIGRIIPRNASSQARTEEQQRQLDDAMERVDFEDVTVAELKEMLRQRGKHGGGKKADLIKRLQTEIEVIRANRNAASRSSAASAPMPIGSPTNSLNRTLGNMHIESPPVNSTLASSPSSHRYSPYGPSATGLSVGQGQGSTHEQDLDNGAGSVVGSGNASSLPRNIALPSGRDTSAYPASSPRMTSLLGSSFIAADGRVHQTPVHPHNQRLKQPTTPGIASDRSPKSSSLKNSLSPEFQHGHQQSMETDTLYQALLVDPSLLPIQQEGFTVDASFLASLNSKPVEHQATFLLEAPLDPSFTGNSPSPTPSLSSVSTHGHARQPSPLSTHPSAHTDIVQAEDGMICTAAGPHSPTWAQGMLTN
ncbi:hypothetical protein KVV02_002954 [Mortierella alpina]|uniref:SAP domain-containing protein n=1 Tax=Mortierella alpina TaxID=64518 RepID=A0A9P8A3I5_MORAP|nr:hypothetical protein KVV02_002954 [Mortierella alpina]